MVKVAVEIPIELTTKIKKSLKNKNNLLTMCEGLSNLSIMPNEHSPDKACVSVWIPRATVVRIKRAAKMAGMTISDYLLTLFIKSTKHIDLTPEDYEQIAKDTRDAIKRKDSKGTEAEAYDKRKKTKKDAVK